MTLDDETAANIARGVVDGGRAARVYPHSTDVALVRAGYAARDAEVERLSDELAEAHTHFAIQEGRIEQFKRERDAALAEVEELRAQLAKVREWAESVALHPDPPADDEMVGQINAAGDVLAILDEGRE